MGNWAKIIWIICAVTLICGCDTLTSHKVLSTIFDGVPAMPPSDQYCQDFHLKLLAEENEAAKLKLLDQSKTSGSSHPPYAEKKCDSCHDRDKESGLIRPLNQLCFVCHPNINAGAFIHGPASVGSCVECHEPHSSAFPSLLKYEKPVLCGTCHREKRLAATMHASVIDKGMLCLNCHNPHSSNAQYFLK